MAASKTFTLKEGLEPIGMDSKSYIKNFKDYLNLHEPVLNNQGRILLTTDPGKNIIYPAFPNGFVGTVYRAYNEHRHLILRPDDVWLAITTAFGGLFMGVKENAQMMRKHFVDFEGKRELEVEANTSFDNVDWNSMISRMSSLVEELTKGDVRSWLEPDFTTTTPVCKTVGRVVLMGAMKDYFRYNFSANCGLPEVTLEGTLDDWKKLREKAQHLSSFEVQSLTHWSGLLDVVLQKMIDSYDGKVDVDFWSHIAAHEGWGSGPDFIGGWVNVFMPFSKEGIYRLNDVDPLSSKWGRLDMDNIPSSCVEVPVTLHDESGEKRDTIFYGGHMVCQFDPQANSIRPSVDWAIVDITGCHEPVPDTSSDYFESPEFLCKHLMLKLRSPPRSSFFSKKME